MSNNLIKEEQLRDILGDLWENVRNRDITAGEVTADTGDAGANRKLKLKRKDNNNTIDIDFTNVALLDKINEFKKYGAFPDIALDELKALSTETLGNVISTGGYDSSMYWSGSRRFSSSQFYDGYINKVRVHLRDNFNTAETPTINNVVVNFITKNGSLTEDRVGTNHITGNYQVIINGSKKYIEIPINRKFEQDTYVLVSTSVGNNFQSVQTIAVENRDGVVHIPKRNQTLTDGQAIPNANSNEDSWCVNYEVIGRMSIKEAISIITSEEYVLVSDTTVEGGSADKAGKVVKLNTDGKIHTSILPELAINRVLTAVNEAAALGKIGDGAEQLQSGDVVVLEDTSKAYMYKGRPSGQTNNIFNRDFLELTMGNGTVKKVNGGTPDSTGNVSATVTDNGTDVRLKFGTDGTDIVIATYMTASEVTAIKNLFTFD